MSIDVRKHSDRKAESDAQSAPAKTSFAETALRLGGKSEDEAQRTGVIDAADDQVEALFSPNRQTTASPIHRAVWDRHCPTDLFYMESPAEDPAGARVMRDSLDVVRKHISLGSQFDEQNKLSESLLRDLGFCGYWGMLVGKEYGGSGLRFQHFAKFLTRMATLEPTVAGLASVHGCIGAVDPVRSFGTDDQKRRFLPTLASGERLSAFALTEPGAGSDLTAMKTTASRDGDDYVVNGEKLFITNAMPGRTIGLVCKIEGRPSVLVVELPASENESFQLNRYGLYALRRAHNNGLVFRNFRVPAENLLQPAYGDGLTIAYHGLNLGRVSLCANAAGTMRSMLSSMLPWAEYRKTYGQSIASRELVRRRIGTLAGLIVGCDALVQWCGGLLDLGYRGEMECIIAKIFGSEAQKYAAIELYMKTHGGRSFLHGHTFGDNVHEFLAPCIYEGEGEMLGMAFFKSLVKQHGTDYFEPIGHVLHDAGISQPNLMNPAHLWRLKRPMFNYATWMVANQLQRSIPTDVFSSRRGLSGHLRFAKSVLSRSGLRISALMRRHQLRLADRQCAMSQMSSQIQDAVTMMTVSLYGMKSADEITRRAADVLCRELRHRITGINPGEADFRAATQLGKSIAEDGWHELADVQPDAIMMPYQTG